MWRCISSNVRGPSTGRATRWSPTVSQTRRKQFVNQGVRWQCQILLAARPLRLEALAFRRKQASAADKLTLCLGKMLAAAEIV